MAVMPLGCRIAVPWPCHMFSQLATLGNCLIVSRGCILNGLTKETHISFTTPRPAENEVLRRCLAEIDVEMEQLQCRLDELALARKPVVESLGSIVYPVLELPPEPTSKLFVEYILASSRLGPEPRLLASICTA